MDAAVRFYASVLGLKLTNRYGNQLATVEAGSTLVIVLHRKTPRSPAPGTRGSVILGLTIDEPIATVVSRLGQGGVRLTSDIVRSGTDHFVEIEDQDGNPIYLWENSVEREAEDDLASTASTSHSSAPRRNDGT
jgi:catechol 2,3-dioxygenase-like lactoylglutathione lyase family enzyme